MNLLVHCHGMVVYVGQASNFKARMSSHRNSDSGQWRAFDDPCCPVIPTFMNMPKPGRDALEQSLIRTHNPPGNVNFNPNPRPYAACC